MGIQNTFPPLASALNFPSALNSPNLSGSWLKGSGFEASGLGAVVERAS